MGNINIRDLQSVIMEYIAIAFDKDIQLEKFQVSGISDLLEQRFAFMDRENVFKVSAIRKHITYGETGYIGSNLESNDLGYCFIPVTCDDETIIRKGSLFALFSMMNSIYADNFAPFLHYYRVGPQIIPVTDIKHSYYIPIINLNDIEDDILKKFVFFMTVRMLLNIFGVSVMGQGTDLKYYVSSMLSLAITCAYFDEYDKSHIFEILDIDDDNKGYKIYVELYDFPIDYAKKEIFNEFFHPYTEDDNLDQLQDIFAEILVKAVIVKKRYIESSPYSEFYKSLFGVFEDETDDSKREE